MGYTTPDARQIYAILQRDFILCHNLAVVCKRGTVRLPQSSGTTHVMTVAP